MFVLSVDMSVNDGENAPIYPSKHRKELFTLEVVMSPAKSPFFLERFNSILRAYISTWFQGIFITKVQLDVERRDQ